MRRRLQFLLVLALAGALLSRESARAPLAAIDRAFASWIGEKVRRERDTAPVVFVQLNDATLEAQPWPWRPVDYALFLQAVLAGNPAVVGLLPVAAWSPGEPHEESVRDLARRIPKLVLGAELGRRPDPDLIPPVEPAPALPNVHGPVESIPEFDVIAAKPAGELPLIGTLGFVNRHGGDGARNAIPLVYRYRGHLAPSAALQASMQHLRVTPDDVVVFAGSHVQIGRNTSVPIDASGAMPVDFGVRISRIPFDELMLAMEQPDSDAGRDLRRRISGGVALLGRADSGAETVANGRGARMPADELFARGVATILANRFPRPMPGPFFLALFAAGMLAGLLIYRSGWRAAWAIASILLFAYWTAALSAFAAWGLVLPLLLPAGLLAAALLAKAVFGEEETPLPAGRA